MFLDLTGVYASPEGLVEYDWCISVQAIKDVVQNRQTSEVAIRLHTKVEGADGLEHEQIQITEDYSDVIDKLRACDIAVH